MPVWFLRLAVLLLAVAASAPGNGNAATLRWANDGDVQAMDPYTRNETVQLSFLANIYEPLIRRDREPGSGARPGDEVGADQPHGLALPSPRRREMAGRQPFHRRRRGVLRRPGASQKPRCCAPCSVWCKEVRKVDELTVDFETKQTDPIFPQELTTWLIMSKAWAEKNNAAEPVNLASGQENYAVRNTMGTGAFRLVLREPDRRTVLERNPDWWDKSESNVDRAEFNVISNPATRVAALLSGEIDMIYTVPPQDMDRIRSTEGLKLITGPELRTIFFGLDQWRDELLRSNIKGRNPLKDVRVREAFALAIDEQAIAARVMRGQAHPTWLMWGPGVNGYDPAQDVRPTRGSRAG